MTEQKYSVKYWLDRFYLDLAAINEAGPTKIAARVELLRRYAEVRCYEPGSDWQRHRRRRIETPSKFCFACARESRPIIRHHVIQLQHGGSNKRRNIKRLCIDCHTLVHPWLQFPQGFDDDFFGPVLDILTHRSAELSTPTLVKPNSEANGNAIERAYRELAGEVVASKVRDEQFWSREFNRLTEE